MSKKELHESWLSLGNDLLMIGLSCASVFIALKFTVFFEHWVYFPFWPNICDSVTLLCTVAYFLVRLNWPKLLAYANRHITLKHVVVYSLEDVNKAVAKGYKVVTWVDSGALKEYEANRKAFVKSFLDRQTTTKKP